MNTAEKSTGKESEKKTKETLKGLIGFVLGFAMIAAFGMGVVYLTKDYKSHNTDQGTTSSTADSLAQKIGLDPQSNKAQHFKRLYNNYQAEHQELQGKLNALKQRHRTQLSTLLEEKEIERLYKLLDSLESSQGK